jgi:hypothetical protein
MSSENEGETSQKTSRLIRVADVRDIIYRQLYQTDMSLEVLDRADTILMEIERKVFIP